MITLHSIKEYFDKNGYPDYDIELEDDLVISGEKSEKVITSVIKELQRNSGKIGYIYLYNYLKKYYLIARYNTKK